MRKYNYTVTVTASNQHTVSRHMDLRRAAISYLRAQKKYQGNVELWDDTGNKPVKLDAERDFWEIIIYTPGGRIKTSTSPGKARYVLIPDLED